MKTIIRFKSWRQYEVEDASKESIEALIKYEDEEVEIIKCITE